MNLLAIDTSSLACSVALQVGDAIVERHEEQAKEHTRLLVPMISAVLAEASLTSHDLDAVVLGNGPGSFIGMRIAASVAQGLAHGSGVPVAPVSSLAAVAAEVLAATKAAEVIVAQDAHMNEVYLGAFSRGGGGLPEALFEERLHTQTPIAELDEADADARVAAGFGWQRYPALLAANEDRIGNTSDVLHPRARFLLPLGVQVVEKGDAIAPQDIAPAYLRSKVAERPRGSSS
jgi:tRNA threonylcarbamoyladenosine biosynthesis protein TsaB